VSVFFSVPLLFSLLSFDIVFEEGVALAVASVKGVAVAGAASPSGSKIMSSG